MAVLEVREAPVVIEQQVGPLGRLGRWAADHLRLVALAWGVVAVVLAIFAPSVETALSGAGWQANGSESVSARSLIEQNFAGLSSSAPMVVVHSPSLTAESPAFGAVVDQVETILRADSRIQSVQAPRRGATISADGHTAIVVAGARGNPTTMVAAADDLKSEAGRDCDDRRLGEPDRRLGHVERLQRGEPLGDAEVRALLLAGDARDPHARLRLARRRRVAADADDPRPAGLGRAAGAAQQRVRDLDLGDELRADVRARARNRLRALRRPSLPRRLLRLETPGARRGRGHDGHRGQSGALLRRDRADLALRGDARAEPRLPLDGTRDHAQRRLRAGSHADPSACGTCEAWAAGGRAAAALGALGRAPLRALRPLGRAALAASTHLRAGGNAPARPARAARVRAEDRHALDQGRT